MNNNVNEPYILEHWGMVALPDPRENPYLAPEQRTCHLMGRVYGNPRFLNGELVTTSRLICAPSDDVVQTANSFYRLGNPDPQYEKMFPDAKRRLITQLRKQCSPTGIGFADWEKPVFDGPSPKRTWGDTIRLLFSRIL